MAEIQIVATQSQSTGSVMQLSRRRGNFKQSGHRLIVNSIAHSGCTIPISSWSTSTAGLSTRGKLGFSHISDQSLWKGDILVLNYQYWVKLIRRLGIQLGYI